MIFYIPCYLGLSASLLSATSAVGRLMSSDWKGMANVEEQKGPAAPGSAAVSSSGGHGGLCLPHKYKYGWTPGGLRGPRGCGVWGWSKMGALTAEVFEQKIMINCPDSSRHSQPGELKKTDPEPSTGWEVGKKLWAVGEELSWVQPWGQR